ncbi:hypothetical protein FN846DRAFT_1001826 [Sphaerosporella brunnea]|uniref:Uncharacterized protein n=1 Tax=Sphaerosporella brunnea TaxID=1250544 RepID=A0A5J5F5I0_9PEZI|nr:hypothetical protein FN846DRAFT_1001826 [Sphaerosporella brunnea]
MDDFFSSILYPRTTYTMKNTYHSKRCTLRLKQSSLAGCLASCPVEQLKPTRWTYRQLILLNITVRTGAYTTGKRGSLCPEYALSPLLAAARTTTFPSRDSPQNWNIKYAAYNLHRLEISAEAYEKTSRAELAFMAMSFARSVISDLAELSLLRFSMTLERFLLRHPKLGEATWYPDTVLWSPAIKSPIAKTPLLALAFIDWPTSDFAKEAAYLISLAQIKFCGDEDVESCCPRLLVTHRERAYLLEMPITRGDLKERENLPWNYSQKPSRTLVVNVVGRWNLRFEEDRVQFVSDMASIMADLEDEEDLPSDVEMLSEDEDMDVDTETEVDEP